MKRRAFLTHWAAPIVVVPVVPAHAQTSPNYRDFNVSVSNTICDEKTKPTESSFTVCNDKSIEMRIVGVDALSITPGLPVLLPVGSCQDFLITHTQACAKGVDFVAELTDGSAAGEFTVFLG